MRDKGHDDFDVNRPSEQIEKVGEQAGFALRGNKRKESRGCSEMGEAPFYPFSVGSLAIERHKEKRGNLLERLEMVDVLDQVVRGEVVQ